jgi:hypothetical protein
MKFILYFISHSIRMEKINFKQLRHGVSNVMDIDRIEEQ